MSKYQSPYWPTNKTQPLKTGLIRQMAEDFQVKEELPFELSGEGEHLWLLIRKRLLATQQVAAALARWAGVKRMAVGFGGQKDKHAVTTQWFSIHLPGQSGPADDFNLDGCEILQVKRHTQKLRRGALKQNRFCIRLRDTSGDRDEVENRLVEISHSGVPNYFTEQRFGSAGDNVAKAAAFFKGSYRVKGREQRSMLLSSVRSWLFNQILSSRVINQSWNNALPGEMLMLAGSHSLFPFSIEDSAIPGRLESGDIHPTGALPGSGKPLVSEAVASLENEVLEQYPELVDGLIKAGVKASRRSLRLIPQSLKLEWEDQDALCLSFALPSGAYATAVLRELVHYTDASRMDR